MSNALMMSEKESEIITQVVKYFEEIIKKHDNPKIFVFYAHTRKRVGELIAKGFVYNDFIRVINYIENKWRNTDFEKYIRPETIFGDKFEIYLRDARKRNTIQKLHNAVEQAKQLVDRGVVKLRRRT